MNCFCSHTVKSKVPQSKMVRPIESGSYFSKWIVSSNITVTNFHIFSFRTPPLPSVCLLKIINTHMQYVKDVIGIQVI